MGDRKKGTGEMNEKQMLIKIQDAIGDLEIVTNLTARGRIEEARDLCLSLYKTVFAIIGGTQKTLHKYDEFMNKWGQIYTEL